MIPTAVQKIYLLE